MTQENKELILHCKSQILLYKLCPEAHECSAAWIIYYKQQIKRVEKENDKLCVGN